MVGRAFAIGTTDLIEQVLRGSDRYRQPSLRAPGIMPRCRTVTGVTHQRRKSDPGCTALFLATGCDVTQSVKADAYAEFSRDRAKPRPQDVVQAIPASILRDQTFQSRHDGA